MGASDLQPMRDVRPGRGIDLRILRSAAATAAAMVGLLCAAPASADALIHVDATYEDRHTSPRVVFHLPQELLDLIDREAGEEDRTRTAEILRALKGYYTARGLWPPAGPPG